MRKVLFTVALLLSACYVSAQVSVVKEAKSQKSDPAKAAATLEPALTNAETANDPNTWMLAGDLQKAMYDEENMKLYLPGGGATADTAKLYNSLAKLYEYYLKADELEQAKVKSGELKKPKLRKKMVKTLATLRPQLTNGGSDAFNAGNYANALKYFGLYVDVANNPIFEGEEAVKNDTLTPLIACYAALAANSLEDKDAVMKYATIGKTHKEEGYRALMCIAEVAGKGENADSTQWLAAIQEGCERFPSQDYFVGNLMDYYIQKGRVAEALSTIDGLLAKNETEYYLYVKGVLQYENKDYENAITTLEKVVAKGGDLTAEAYAKMGDCYFFPAQELVEQNATLAMEDPKYAENENKIKDLYTKAEPYYKKAKEVAPDKKTLWGNFLLNIYWKLNKADYDNLTKELGM